MGPLSKLLFGSCVVSFDPGIKVNYIPTKYILAGNRPGFPHCKVDCWQRNSGVKIEPSFEMVKNLRVIGIWCSYPPENSYPNEPV